MVDRDDLEIEKAYKLHEECRIAGRLTILDETTIEYQRIGFNEEPQKITIPSDEGHADSDITLRASIYDSMLHGFL